MATKPNPLPSAYQMRTLSAFVWMLLMFGAYGTAISFFIVDASQRWGAPLILEWHQPTVMWLVAFIFARIAGAVFTRKADGI